MTFRINRVEAEVGGGQGESGKAKKHSEVQTLLANALPLPSSGCAGLTFDMVSFIYIKCTTVHCSFRY